METAEHRVTCRECGVETTFSHANFERYRLAQTLRLALVVFAILLVAVPLLALISVLTVSWLYVPLVLVQIEILRRVLPKRIPIPKMGQVAFPCANCKVVNRERPSDEDR
jgi:hypothetical protein